MLEGSAISAVLGPTNTGKTHRAVERMLTYDTGMIGLPLRLLAREIYDRVSARVGEGRVALVTGEEKRIPRSPAYWVCTVEAMPVSREVDFVAVDEIQLAAHRQRGHVFTERLLSLRGRRETWFLGADTMREAFAELVPSARIVSHPRLSKLSFRGMDRLSKIPPRSAVIGFSAAQVFELGERLRALRGGVAVVMGALSPRTRNAQVAMFQAGEVDYLVATDAVGMGLNLHVGHVAFAALRKFDGERARDLDVAELAQIAGRAGRHTNDGTFGTVSPILLPDDAAHAIETHRFSPVKRLMWRSPELDYGSVEKLLASLRDRPRSRWLALVDDAEDTLSLSLLAGDERVRREARGEARVRLLWDVCRIPDFRKLLPEIHAALVGEVFLELCGPSGCLSDDWMELRVRAIDDAAGEVETLTDRLAKIRTLTYLASHAGWTEHASAWQEHTRAVEDRLGDALHDRLVMRFVERGGKRRKGRPKGRAHASPVVEGAASIDASHPFARLAGLRASVVRSQPAPLAPGEDAWIEALVAAPHAELALAHGGIIAFQGRAIGRLSQGARLLLPEVKLAALDDLGAGARTRVTRRLTAYARDLVHELLGTLRGPELSALSPAARGVLYQLEQGLGTARAKTAGPQLDALSEDDRTRLATLGIVLGAHVLWVPRLLARARLAERLALVSAFFERAPRSPGPGAASIAKEASVAESAYLALGYLVSGPRALRADVAERVLSAVRAGGVDRGRVAHWMGCSPAAAARVLEELSRAPEGDDAAEAAS